ncbi:oligosaccharide flippase family protein, partial [Glaciimonas sp. CA11.2]
VLARVLTPAEIGIFSMTSVVVNFSHVFRDFGVTSYIRRAKVLTPEIIRSATGVLVTSSWMIATLLYFVSNYVAEFFKQPGVGEVMRVLAIGFYFIPLGAIPQAVLGREFQAEKSALVSLISTPVYVSTSLILAYHGFSYMTMAWANLANIIVTGLVFTVLRPKGLPWLPSFRGWRAVAHFGMGAMLSSTIRAIDNAVPDIVLGRMSGPKNVGLFSRSNSVVNIFNTIAGPTINYMALPYLAKTHHEGRDLAVEVARAITLLTGLIWSALAITASLAPDLIAFLYGPAWVECAPIVPMLCIACAVQATFAFMQPALTGIGRPYWSAFPMASSLIVKIILVLLIFKNDLISFSWIIVVAEFFSIPGYLYLARRYINLSPSVILKSTRGSLAISIIMVLCATLAVRLLNGYQTPFVRLVITLAFLTPAWIGAVFFFRHPLSGEIKTAYHTFFTKIKTVQIR